ncbi:27800_t:CDS:2, partial [Racocetra persica]
MCQEISDYPNNSIIKYITPKFCYIYEIIEAGIQLSESYLAQTQKPNTFSIPDKSDPDDFVCSNLLATTAANAYIT